MNLRPNIQGMKSKDERWDAGGIIWGVNVAENQARGSVHECHP